MTISCSSSFSPSISAWTRTLVRSSVGFSRRSAISSPQRLKSSGMSRSITDSMPSGFRSGSLAPSIEFMSRAHMMSSSGGIPMKLPITRETTGWATSATRSQVSLPSSRSSTPIVISRIASSCSAIRFGVNPRWKSILRRSCFGGSMPMNIERISSTGMTGSVIVVMPPRSEEYVCQSMLTVRTSSAVVIDQKPGSPGNSLIASDRCTGHSPRIRLKSSYGGPSPQCSRSRRSISSTGVFSDVSMPPVSSLVVLKSPEELAGLERRHPVPVLAGQRLGQGERPLLV